MNREPWSGKLFAEEELELLRRVLRSIRDEQPGASSAVKALAGAVLDHESKRIDHSTGR
ncbi:MAG: hypothetical protein IT381_12560 [Deltaproteobacteria bacterium]|nr:hypothetical protein [Deltaproteobacteria bacterium]